MKKLFIFVCYFSFVFISATANTITTDKLENEIVINSLIDHLHSLNLDQQSITTKELQSLAKHLSNSHFIKDASQIKQNNIADSKLSHSYSALLFPDEREEQRKLEEKRLALKEAKLNLLAQNNELLRGLLYNIERINQSLNYLAYRSFHN